MGYWSARYRLICHAHLNVPVLAIFLIQFALLNILNIC
jgi:hypothetical protein